MKTKKATRARNAADGTITTKEHAKRNPKTTVIETVTNHEKEVARLKRGISGAVRLLRSFYSTQDVLSHLERLLNPPVKPSRSRRRK